jgi:hypothetical protein
MRHPACKQWISLTKNLIYQGGMGLFISEEAIIANLDRLERAVTHTEALRRDHPLSAPTTEELRSQS